MIAEFMTYYHYSLDQTLMMYAVSFYALLASMYRLKAVETQEKAYMIAVAFAGGDSFKEYIEHLDKQAKGAQGLLDEVRVVRNARKNK